MFSVESEGRQFAVKPMNCPCHVQVYNQGLKSYRDLPIRLAEFGSCHRNEPSGALHGLMRVRGFVQDDAHIFCQESQIAGEVSQFIDFLHEVYADFGFTDIIYRLSTRPENRVGSDADWDKSEKALADALDAKNIEWQELPGEGAFYGPKIEFSLRDCLGRVWQCGTIQLDFQMPERFDLTYVASDNEKKRPVMIHRTILGSIERFMGILIEHYAGRFPAWIAPVQVIVLPISDKFNDYAEDVKKQLADNGIRVELDHRSEKVGFKIREAQMQQIPYMLIVGEKEVEEKVVSVRGRETGDVGQVSLEDFMEGLKKEIRNKE